ncbi:glycoside hydrolase family 16 protein [Jaapia argillacea MUCL 33604]|uniref:Glycoside hydrolase family 16 protein n=1 Tax=Jaapia argillacea MUCL 33604 TaxID=933084 RepID=A0A067PXI4_9AGAM|nr:glycoside hydrolase family 16 protein [Jaapia argillacea MUCL 33604]
MKGPFLTLLLASSFSATTAYNLVRDYSGQNFFSGWNFYGNYDNLTSGDVIFVNQTNATADHLAYVNSAGHAIIKVDNTTNVPYNYKRNSVRIETQDYFPVGSVWIIDLLHLPYGCSVWPAFWTSGQTWPQQGEIDIIEGVNLMTYNQMALHTTAGCTKTTPADQTGTSTQVDCSTGQGCTVAETKPNSFGAAFAQAGGGVWATQFESSGIYIWFWSRANVPASINASSNSVDPSTWGNPSAAYPSTSCSMAQFFGAQQLIVDITLCGDWAGLNSTYHATCNPNGICYNDNVMGPGSPTYDNAYFEIDYIRAYATGAASTGIIGPTPSTSSSSTKSGSAPGTTSTSVGVHFRPSMFALGCLLFSFLLFL